MLRVWLGVTLVHMCDTLDARVCIPKFRIIRTTSAVQGWCTVVPMMPCLRATL